MGVAGVRFAFGVSVTSMRSGAVIMGPFRRVMAGVIAARRLAARMIVVTVIVIVKARSSGHGAPHVTCRMNLVAEACIL